MYFRNSAKSLTPGLTDSKRPKQGLCIVRNNYVTQNGIF